MLSVFLVYNCQNPRIFEKTCFMKFWTFLTLVLLIFSACNNTTKSIDPVEAGDFYRGADLSYVNEVQDCGAIYLNREGRQEDPYAIFKNSGSNLIRLRLWHSPDWTDYSTYEDVERSIQRAKEQNMEVLLDFHYSDTWADPHKQKIPKAWENEIDNTEVLGDSVYNYTYKVLSNLKKKDLLPDIVQVGNEINAMILQGDELEWPIDWDRNSYLINKGIEAVRDASKNFNKNIGVMLHIAQPENALWWFQQATENNVNDFDWIGLSYYPKWSTYDLNSLPGALDSLVMTYAKKLMIVETAYPFTLENNDAAGNILGEDALVDGYELSPIGQLNYLNKLKSILKETNSGGLIYWEPAWVSSSCETLWGIGSHWDNATLFDHSNKATVAMDFYNNN